MVVNSLWGLLWAGLRGGIDDLCRRRLDAARARADVRGATVWLVGEGLVGIDVFADPVAAQEDARRRGRPVTFQQRRIG